MVPWRKPRWRPRRGSIMRGELRQDVRYHVSRCEEYPVKKSPAPRRKTNGRGSEVAALLAAARAVLENRAFADAARAVLGACKTILGADAGLVATYPAGGKSLEIAVLDPGSLELSSAAGLPAPLRRLSARASKGRTAFANGLSKST